MITLPTPNAGAVFNGLDGCPIYQRSLDNGQTWDITNKIPDGVDSTNTSGWSGDSYTIASKGNTVAFVHGQVTDDWAVWISHDNGDTWTKTVIMDFPFVKYDDVNNMTDVDGDGVADTVLTTDHKMAILIDNNGMVHCWAGALYVLDLDIPSQLGLFLSTDALLYWNESMGSAQPVVIAQTPDVDGDGQLTFAPNYVPRYGNGGQCSQPYAAIDASGTIIVSFAAPLENSTTGTTGADYSYRNIWMIGSTDNGVTWSDPIQVAGSEFDEAVFGSLARDINGCVDLVYQMDGLPGIAVQPPNSNQAFHPFSSNDIMHDCIPVTSIVGIKEIQQQPPVVTVSPNPVSDLLNITITAGTADRVQLIISDITGKKVYQDNISTAGTGIFSFSHSVKNLSKGMYLLSINAEGAVSTSKFVVQ
ncbi:MAG: T9SS type A sorting domain-containing protein [Bacteroidia bacterium]|nr:T9SS type A sorting domain-containing protein [Bacteroidia bacterium]